MHGIIQVNNSRVTAILENSYSRKIQHVTANANGNANKNVIEEQLFYMLVIEKLLGMPEEMTGFFLYTSKPGSS